MEGLTELIVSLYPSVLHCFCERLYLNRASGGRLASLWQRGENEQDRSGTAAWLPDWVLLSALSDTVASITRWIAEMWNGRRVLSHLEHAQSESTHPRAVGRNVLAWLLEQENTLLLVLSSLLLVVWFARRRRIR